MHFSYLHLTLLLAYPFFILSKICYVKDFSESNKLKFPTLICDGECVIGSYYFDEIMYPFVGCLQTYLNKAREYNDSFMMSRLDTCRETGVYKNYNTATQPLYCCDFDYCNDPYGINCYISIGSMENWQESEFKLEQHFPLYTCTALFFTLDYAQLSFRDFIKNEWEFRQHWENSLSLNTKLFMEMLKLVKEIFRLQTAQEFKRQTNLIFSIGTTNNPYNDSKLGEQIENDFNLVIQSSESRQLFAQNCMLFLEEFGLDGIDIAHGYPDLNATVELFRQIRGVEKYLTFFPAPPANIKNITSKVLIDNRFFTELMDDKVNINLFYDYKKIMDFMRGYPTRWGYTFFGVKFTFNQPRIDGSKYNFTGTYNEYARMPDFKKHRDYEYFLIQNLLTTEIAVYTGGLAAMFLDWDDFAHDKLILNFVKNILLNQTQRVLTTKSNETLQKEIQEQFQIVKKKEEAKELMKKEEKKKRDYNYVLVGFIIVFLVLFLVLALIILFFSRVDDDDAILFDEMPKIFVKNGFDLNGKNFSLQSKKRRLGEGSFGKVFLAKYTGSNNLVEFDSGRLKASLLIDIGQFACKIVRITQDGGEDHVLQEFVTLKDCQHEHIVRAFGVILLRRQIAIVMEFMPFGDLHRHLRSLEENKKQLRPKARIILHCTNAATKASTEDELPRLEDIYSWMFCVIKAMKYLHGKDILHRDLAARNCLFMDEDRKFLKLGDFGLARHAIDYGREYKCAKDKPIAWPWMAKELVFSEEKTIAFTKASDVWSFGVLVWEMCSRGAKPYDAEPGDMERVKSWLERLRPLQCPPLARYDLINEHILKACFSAENQRPKFEELEGIVLSLIRGQIPIKRNVVIISNILPPIKADAHISPILATTSKGKGPSSAKSARKDDSMAIVMEKFELDMISALDKQENLAMNVKELLMEKMGTFKSAVKEILDGKENADEENSTDSDEVKLEEVSIEVKENEIEEA